jgi:kynurenine formamidase
MRYNSSMTPVCSPEWVDLTLPLMPAMPVYPGDPPVAFLSHAAWLEDGFRVTAVRLGTHTGTHLDAPAHFLADGVTVDQLSLQALVGPARIIDATQVPAGCPVRRADFGEIARGERLLLRTDWHRAYGRDEYYNAFPSLAGDAVEGLVEAGAALIGMETPSLCSDHDQDARAHTDLLRAGIVILEGLTGLDRLPPSIWLIALPLRLAGLDGSPCRVIAAGL